ncbi:MAG: DNA-3-methyladenine glycosylase [Acidimicrobiia bacterium]
MAPPLTVPLPRAFYRRDPRVVAPELLNKVLVVGRRSGRVVEVEAYAGAEDPASHAFRGRTPRNASMFGPPGLLYVYRSYGIHWCANAVCGEEGVGVAVLLRALAPLTGLDAMRAARPGAARDRDLCRGPGRLCQALGITGAHDGADLVTADRGPFLADDGTPPPADPANTGRVGLTSGVEHRWRWYVAGEPNVSPGRPAASGGPLRPAG